MILEEERLILKELLGSRYTADVKKKLLQKGITSQGAETFSRGFISNVFSGTYENTEVETAIWEVAAERKAKKEMQERLKQDLMNAQKNPPSGNSAG